MRLMRKGIGVSPGVAIGTAYCIHEIYVNPDTKRLEASEVTQELAEYEAAREQTARDLRALQQKVEKQVGRDAAAIFSVHESILRDAAFTEKIRDWIVDDRLTAQAALHRLMEEYGALFSRTEDLYLRERVADLRDVVIRLSSHLSEIPKAMGPRMNGPLIVVADELLPSQAIALDEVEVKGIITQSGSRTSHAAILARSRGIPAVTGVPGILRHVRNGDKLVVDGSGGQVALNPDAESLAAFRKLEREFFLIRDHMAANRDDPAITTDGVSVELLANINSVADARAAVKLGADGVGLFRTEYIYLAHPDVPDEEEQLAAYQEIIEASPGQVQTIRTLDIGGDKTVPYLGHQHQEANPFLGWRSIRLSFEHPEFFLTQVRAVLRAAAFAKDRQRQLRLMFPMITTLEEMHRLRALVRKASKQLAKEKIPHCAVPLGMMLEVPAAAIIIDDLLPAVDFVSVGSNDLVQYVMAADRDNPKVSHLCQPLAPAVLRLLSRVIQSCRQADKPVTICGEMAGQPRAFLLLLGMGMRSFSMSPAFIPMIKQLTTLVSTKQASDIARKALAMRTIATIRRYMTQQIDKLAPKLHLLDPL